MVGAIPTTIAIIVGSGVGSICWNTLAMVCVLIAMVIMATMVSIVNIDMFVSCCIVGLMLLSMADIFCHRLFCCCVSVSCCWSCLFCCCVSVSCCWSCCWSVCCWSVCCLFCCWRFCSCCWSCLFCCCRVWCCCWSSVCCCCMYCCMYVGVLRDRSAFCMPVAFAMASSVSYPFGRYSR